MMSSQTNKAVIQKGFDAWNGGDEDFATWAHAAVAPSVEVQVPVLSTTGIEAYLAYLRDIRAAFPDARVRIDEIVADEQTVVVLYTFSGTNTGLLLSRPIVTGKPASFTTVDTYHFADGKIVGYAQLYDRLGLLEALDALDAAAHPTVVPWG
jgi:predicted ester cyclase